MYLLSPDDIVNFLSSPFILAFWPGIIGFLMIFLLASKGPRWLILPVLATSSFYQAWHLGII